MFRVNGNNSIDMIRGDTVMLDITVTKAGGAEYELTDDDELLFTVKKDTHTSEALIQKQGAHIVIEPADTESLEYGSYVYDVQLTTHDGIVDTIIPPTRFKILEEVTW